MSDCRPPPGTMVYWKFIRGNDQSYHFGYCTYHSSYDLVRMGRWNGDTAGGCVVSINDIDWRYY